MWVADSAECQVADYIVVDGKHELDSSTSFGSSLRGDATVLSRYQRNGAVPKTFARC
jgi:hypothetical protein